MTYNGEIEKFEMKIGKTYESRGTLNEVEYSGTDY